jgi:hypothetical protein
LALLDRKALTWALLHTEELIARSSKGEATSKPDHESHHTKLITFMATSQDTASSSVGSPIGLEGENTQRKVKWTWPRFSLLPIKDSNKTVVYSVVQLVLYLDDCNGCSWLDDSESRFNGAEE